MTHKQFDTSYKMILFATFIMLLGFYLVSHIESLIPIPNLGYFSLVLFGSIAYWLVFGSMGYQKLFQRPIHFRKNFFKYFLLANLFALFLGGLITYLTHLHKANPADNNPLWFFFLIMPFALIGEEIFSIYFYNLFKLKLSPLVANLFVCILFGLIHYWTYFNGSVILTIIQVIAVQGSARFWFNQSYEKSGSLLTSFAIHYVYDFIGFMLVLFIHR